MTTVIANFRCECEDFPCPHCGTIVSGILMYDRDQKIYCVKCQQTFIVKIFFEIPLPYGGLK